MKRSHKYLTKLFLFFGICLLLYQPALAGGIGIRNDTFIINNSRGNPYSANWEECLSFEFLADQYVYGRFGDKGYIIFVFEKETGYKMKNSVGYRFYFIAPLRGGESGILYHIRTSGKIKEYLGEGRYIIKYCRVPIFHSDMASYPQNRDIPWGGELLFANSRFENQLSRFVRNKSLSDLGNIMIVSNDTMKKVALYLKINNEIPGLNSLKTKRISEEPIEFTWYTKGTLLGNPSFRYRLLPDEEWSEWDERKKKVFYYMARGNQTFEVEGKYSDSNGEEILIAPARYTINLGDKPFVAKPKEVFLKADASSYDNYFLDNEKTDRMYKNKYALLIGIEYFTDNKFGQLPYMKKDLELIENSLRNLNFIIKKPGNILSSGKLISAEVINLIQNNIKALKEDDFLIIYISSHGFDNFGRGYIACSNCVRDTGEGCLTLESLEKMVSTKNHEGRHILILLDTCSSGLGIIKKDSSFPERDMVFKRGSIMITAGLENQSAQMITNLKSSVFTFFLTKGLDGEADIIKDNVITTTELILYVRYNVANYTNGMQVPMMGKLSGSGEMVFQRKLDKKSVQ